MLQVPIHTVVDDVTVYSDDALFYVYYLIPETPRVRLDDNGHPVFLLVAYEFSAEDRSAHPDLPIGGGYLNFDTELAVAPDTMSKIRTRLQAEVDAEWSRRRAGTADEQASVASLTTSPEVRFDTPTWTAGKVSVDAPQTDSLISARVSEGSPSLLQGDTAVFNLDLTPAGATFLEQTLTAPQGTGATDLTPIQVGYDLKFWARLPTASIVVTADSKKVHDYIHQQMEGRGVDNCTTYDFDHTDLTTDTITASGAITVAIDQGSGSMPPEALNDLRDYAMDLVKEMISSSFFSTSGEDNKHPGDSPGAVRGSGNSKKFYLKDYNEADMHLDVHLQQRSVVEWEIFPQATIQSFFQGMSATELSRYIRKISLDDPFWRTLDIEVRAFADWTGPVSWVQVDLEYGRPGPDLKSTSFTFDATHAAPQSWSQNIVDGDVAYRYRTTIAFDNQDAPAPGPWQRTTVPVVNVQASAPTLDITVLAGDIDFETVDRVEVILAYEDADHGVPREEHSVILTKTATQDHYQRVIYQPIARQASYRTRTTLVPQAVQDDPTWHPVSGPQLVVNSDRSAVLQVGLLPSGDGWNDIVRVLVELEYADGAYEVGETIDLEGLTQFKTWTVPLRNPKQRAFRYRWVASFKNGQLTSTDWQAADGDADTVAIAIHRQGFSVALMPDAIDFTVTPIVQVTCRYTQPGLDREETFVFRDKTAQSWVVDVPDGSPTDFSYLVSYTVPGADPQPPTPLLGHGEIVVLPAYRGPHPMSVAILGGLVDFSTTPLVGVDTTFDQGPGVAPLTSSFTLSVAQQATTWVFTPTTAASDFGYVITYFTADGQPHPRPPQHNTAPRIIVPRFSIH